MGPWFREDILQLLQALRLTVALAPTPAAGEGVTVAEAYAAGYLAALTAVAVAIGVPVVVQGQERGAW